MGSSSSSLSDRGWPPMDANGPVFKLGALSDEESDVYVCESLFSSGSVKWKRTMAIIHNKRAGSVVLVNAARVDSATEEAVKKLGRVTDVVRLSTHHGRDELYYAESGTFPKPIRFWAPAPTSISGARHKSWAKGRNVAYEPFREGADALECLPGWSAAFVVVEANMIEACLFHPSKKLLITADVIQEHDPKNSNSTKISDLHAGVMNETLGSMMGYRGHLMTPSVFMKNRDLQAFFPRMGQIMDLDWTSLIPGHGSPVMHQAKRDRLEWQSQHSKFPPVSFGETNLPQRKTRPLQQQQQQPAPLNTVN